MNIVCTKCSYDYYVTDSGSKCSIRTNLLIPKCISY